MRNSQKPFLRAAIIAGMLVLVPGCDDDKAPGAGQENITAEPVPSAPDVLPSTLKVKRKEKTYVITGIGVKGSHRMAIINNQVVEPGQMLDDGVYVKDVQSTYAIIVAGNTQHLLRPEDIQRDLDRKKQQN